MKTLTSTEFRQRYAALEEPTEVTVLGRLIGTWFPVGPQFQDMPHTIGRKITPPGTDPYPPAGFEGVPLNTRPFTPVPKKGKK